MKHKLLKLMAVIMATALLCGLVPLSATAEEVSPKDLMSLVATSRSEVYPSAKDGSPVLAVAFRYRIDAQGIVRSGKGETNCSKATVSFQGETYRLVSFGAVMSNKAAIGTNPDGFKIGSSGVTKIAANYLFSSSNNHGEFIARVINVPEDKQDALIYARAYFVCKDKAGKDVTFYGEINSANASGKKVRYAVELDALSWFSGTLDKTTGTETVSKKEICTDYINNTDLLIRLPEKADGTPTAYVRAYYYSADAFLSSVDVTTNWTVLKDLGIPKQAVAVRLVAYAVDGAGISDSAAFGGKIQVTANKKGEVLPLAFQNGGLSAETGAEVERAGVSRTTYLPVQNLLVRPEYGTAFKAYFYDAEKTFISAGSFFMEKAKKVLDLAPEEAAYVRFFLQYTDLDGQEVMAADSGLVIPSHMVYFNAYLPNTNSYEDFIHEAEEAEGDFTLPTQSTETTTTATTTSSTSKPASSSSAVSSTTNSTTNTSKPTTSSTTKPTTSTTKPTTSTTKPTIPDEPLVLTDDVPENQGVQNAIWRIQQMVRIAFTPIRTLPQSYKDVPANVTQKGIPYSSSRVDQAYVPQNVSFHTFMTAMQNPNSYLYTVDLGEDYGNVNGDTYYGAVCSTACGYALNLVGDYTTYQWTQIPGMTLLENQDLQCLKLGDTIVGQGHVLMITGITRDQYGNIVKVRISQAAGVDVHNVTYTITAMEEAYPTSKYEYCRYSYIKDVPYTASEYVAVGDEVAQTVTYNTDIIPRKGDKANWRTSEAVILDVLNKATFTKVEIYKYADGTWEKQSTKTIDDTIKLTKQAPGTYRARLTNGTKNSKWCYWKVVDAISKGEHYEGTRKVKVSFSSETAEPLFIQWMNGHTNATVRITPLTKEQKEQGYGIFIPARGELKVRVAFKTAYGIIYSELPEIITVQ